MSASITPASESKGLPQNGDEKCNYEAKPMRRGTGRRVLMSALTSTRALRALVNEIETNAPLAVEAYTTHATARESSRKLEGELLAAILAELARPDVRYQVAGSAIWSLAGPKTWADIITSAESAVHGTSGTFIGLVVDLEGNLHTVEAGDGRRSVTAEDAADRFGLQTILDAIADRLDVAINSHPKSAVKVKRHVEIVHACLVLLRKGREPGGGP